MFAIKQPSPFTQSTFANYPAWVDFAFDRPAQARTYYGQAVEEILCTVLGLDAIDTDARFKYCFDAQAGGDYFEIKSVCKNASVPVYKCRLEKDKAAGVPLYYLLAVHDLRNARTGRDIWQGMADTLKTVYWVPAWLVRKIARKQKLVTCKSKRYSGHLTRGYEQGYHLVNPKHFNNYLCTLETHRATVHGFDFDFELRKLILEE